MSYFNPANSAEASDRLANLVALAVAVAALLQSINVITALTSLDFENALETVQTVGGIAILTIFLPLLIWFKRHRFGRSVNLWSKEGFLSSVSRRAGMTAFGLTLVASLVMSVLDNLLLSKVSAEVMLDIIITLMLALFSLCFFVFSSGSIDDDAGMEA